MYKLLTTEQVKVDVSRQRTTMDPVALGELADSIRDNRLLHAIVVDSNNRLIAGERRLRAVEHLNTMGDTFWYGQKKVPIGFIPAIDVGDLTDTERYELELEENIRRADLSWQERVVATERLARLKTEITLAETGIPPSAAELVTELSVGAGESTHSVRDRLDLARNLHRPEVSQAKTQKDALKALKRVVQAEEHAKLAETVGRTYDKGGHQLFCMDSQKWMTETEKRYDCICTDPPYGMGADSFGDSGGVAAGGHGYSDDADTLAGILQWAPALFWRVTKPQAHIYVFCDIRWFEAWRIALATQGFRVFRTPLIWSKPNGRRAPWPELGPWRQWEMCVYAVKGDRPATRLYPDVMTHSSDENLGHAAQKPVSLYIDLLQRTVLPGDEVLDPFAGSGPVFEAAHALHTTATGVEQDASSYGIAYERMLRLKGGNDGQGT